MRNNYTYKIYIKKEGTGMQKGKVILFLFVLLGSILGFDSKAFAEQKSRSNNIKSMGSISYDEGKVYVTADDFRYLANEVDKLEQKYKILSVNALNEIGTFFKKDGAIVYDKSASEVNTEEDKTGLSFGQILNGIKKSQSVEWMPQVREANADNLSEGTAAWVNGTLIVGNGADCKENYIQGYLDGQQSITSNLNISYTYHQHEGEKANGSGCYNVPRYHKHNGDSVSGGGCYTKANYHVHQGNSTSGGGCYSIANTEQKPVYTICTGTKISTYKLWSVTDGSENWCYRYVCDTCGDMEAATAEKRPDKSCAKQIIGGYDSVINGYILGCGKTESYIENYTTECGKDESTLEEYILGCGKTEDTIESATIIY